MITAEILKQCMPAASIASCTFAAPHLEAALQHYKINSPKDRAMLLANIAHETASLKSYSENLNYSADGLLRVFKNYFTPDQAKEYERKPEKIANRVYANRLGNGNELSGDGWRYRGAGAIQTTGKDNHAKAAREFGKTLEEVSPWLRDHPGAMWSAVYYWHSNALSTIASKPDTWKVLAGSVPV